MFDEAKLRLLEQDWQQKRAARGPKSTTTASKSRKPGWTAWLSELGGTGGALGGAATGATIGSVVPGIGTAIGGIVGGGLGAFLGGGGGKLAEQRIRDPEESMGTSLRKAAGEGAIEGIFGAGPLRLGKIGAQGAKAALKGAGKQGVKEAVETAVTSPGLLSRVAGGTRSKAVNSMLRATPTAYERAAESGLNLTDLGKKWLPKLGNNYDEILPNLKNTLTALEGGIGNITKQAGRTVRLSGDDVVKNLKAELRVLKPKLGSSAKVKQLENLIDEAGKKYKDGITATKARQLLKDANSEFGRSIVDTTGDAVVRSAQKVEANAIRKSLKDLFPGIKTALDNESELLTMREVLKRASAGKATKGFDTVQLQSMFGLAQKALGSQPVSGRIASAGSKEVAQEAIEEGTQVVGRQGLLARTGEELADMPMRRRAGLTSRVLAGSGASGMVRPPETPGQPDVMGDMTDAETGIPDAGIADVDTASGLLSSMPSGGGQTAALTQGLQQAALQALSKGDTEGLKNIMGVAELFTSLGVIGTPEDKGLNSTASGVIADTKTGLQSLETLRGEIGDNSANAPVIGRIRGSNPYDTGAQSLQAKIATAKQIVGKALEGGVLRKEDEVKYAKLLPTMGDTDATATNKIDGLMSLIGQRLSEYQRNLSGGSGGLDMNALTGGL